MAHTAHAGVNIANKVKNDIERMIDTAETEFEALRKAALTFIEDTAKRQAEMQQRITRFTEDWRHAQERFHRRLQEAQRAQHRMIVFSGGLSGGAT